MKLFFLIIMMSMCNFIYTKDNVIKFIKSYIENERKPTDVIFNGLCWKKSVQIKLINEMTKIGVRSSSGENLISKYRDQNVLFLVDLNCVNFEQILLNAASKKQFLYPFRWLILSSENETRANEMVLTLPILPDSDLVIAKHTGDDFKLTELHKPAINFTMISTPRGFYNGSLIDVRPERELFRRRRDLMGHTLVISNTIQDSNASKYHIEHETRLDLHQDSFTRLCHMAAKDAFGILNATRRHIYSYKFGYKVNGSWTGMIEQLEHGKADIGTNVLLFIDRLEVIAFTVTMNPCPTRFIFRQPSLPYVTNVFSLPFANEVWLAIIVCSLACTATLCFTSHWEVKIEKNPTQLDGSVGDALLLTMSAVTQQGCFIEPRRAPGRIMELVFFLCLMALYAAYSANVVVLLQSPSNAIKTLDQLASSGIELGANDLIYNRFILSPAQTQKDSVHQVIHDKIIPKSGKSKYYHINEGVERIRKGLFAFHSISEPVYRRIEKTFLESEKCDITEIDFTSSLDATTPVKKDSPYLELLRVAHNMLCEVGVVSALNRRMQIPKPRCLTSQAAFSSVGLLDMKPVMLLMLYGAAISLTIMLMEVVVYKLTQFYNRK